MSVLRCAREHHPAGVEMSARKPVGARELGAGAAEISRERATYESEYGSRTAING